MDLVQLDIAAIRQSDSQNNAYVLLLNEKSGNRQLPIVIGWCEARSIAIALEGSSELERPLTHDLFKTFSDSFSIIIEKVVIHTLIEGIFHASFYCTNKKTGEEKKIDARTSDAIAISIRNNCPIFTYEEILTNAGIIINSAKNFDKLSIDQNKKKSPKKTSISSLSIKKLNQLLEIAIEQENYEKASKIRDEIKRRKKDL